MAEDGRVAIRPRAPDTMEHLKKDSKSGRGDGGPGGRGGKGRSRKLTDQYIGKIDAHLAAKEEILTV